MSNFNYCIIDTVALKCVNIAVWDGVSDWNPGSNLVAQLSDGSIPIGATVALVGGSYQFAG